MSNKKSKKALSPIITTVLLIVVALVLASIIYFWASNFKGEQISKFDQPIEQACEEVQIDAAISGDNSLSIINQGSLPIYKISVLVISGGTTDKLDKEVNIAGGQSAAVIFTTASFTGKNVEVVPILLGSVKGDEAKKEEYSCTSAKVTASQ